MISFDKKVQLEVTDQNASPKSQALPFVETLTLTLPRLTAAGGILLVIVGIAVAQFRPQTTMPFLLAAATLCFLVKAMSAAERHSVSAIVSGFRGLCAAIMGGVVLPIGLAALIWLADAHPFAAPVMASVEATESVLAVGIEKPESSQLPVMAAIVAPCLQGATNGTVGEFGCDATYIQSYNSHSEQIAREKTLSGLSALLSVVGNAAEVLGLSWGVTVIIFSQLQLAPKLSETVSRVSVGAASVFLGLAAPNVMGFLTQLLSDSCLFH